MPQTLIAMEVAADIYEIAVQKTLVITSVNDSDHMVSSLHYKGLAFDCRTRDLTPMQISVIVRMLKEALTSEFDIVLESDHIHIEYDPKHEVKAAIS